jgi:hypothetical protein
MTTRFLMTALLPLNYCLTSAMRQPLKTEFFQAIDKGDEPGILALLQQGADVNCRDEQQRTALIRAALLDNARLAALLLENGADASLADFEGQTAMGLAGETSPYKKPRSAYSVLYEYWEKRYRENQPIPPADAAMYLEAYSHTFGHAAFKSKGTSQLNAYYEGYFYVDGDVICFLEAYSPLADNADEEEIVIPISQIDMSSLMW